MLAFVVMIVVLAALAAPAGATTPAGFEQQFASPSSEVRPRADWFLPESIADLDADVMESQVRDIAGAGLGGVDLFNVDMALTADQNDLLKRSLEAAKRHDITLDLTIGAAFPPVGVPTTVPGSGAEQQELIYGTALVDGGQTFDGPVPEPQTDPARPRTLVAVVAARCSASCTGEPSVLLEKDSLKDLTDATGPGGELRWTAPGGAGQWVLFAFWRRSTETPYADYFSPVGTKAVTDYWDEHVFTPEIEALLDDAGGQLFEDSLHLEGFQLWSRDFPSEFKRRRGYSLRKYLPVTVIPFINDWLTQTFFVGQSLNPDSPSDYDFAGDAGRRIRNDYYQTLSELYEEHHLVPLNRWARSHGLRFRVKTSYGQTFDISAAQLVDIPNTESFQHGNRIDGNRAIAGAAHLGRKNILAVECCPTATRVGHDRYSTTWRQMLAVLHNTYAAGANQVMLHGFAYESGPGEPWPGAYWPFVGGGVRGPLGFAEPFGPWMPYWQHMPDITDFIGREQAVLRRGQPKVDVAIYRHSLWSHGFPLLESHVPQDDWFKDKTLERAGYSYDFVGPRLFERPNARVDGRRLDPGGPAYKALVLDTPEQVNSVDGMPLEAAKRILDYARAGLPVVLVGDSPDRTGFFSDQSDDPAVRRTIARLLDQRSVHQVATEAEVPGLLAVLSLGPDFAPDQPSNVLSAHRSGDGVDFYFLYNRDMVDAMTGEPSPPPAPFDENVSLAGRGQPYELDAWTGKITRIGTWKRVDGRVETKVSLTPGQSTIIVVGPRGWERGARLGENLHAERTTADEIVARRGDELWVRDTEPGSYRTKLAGGRQVTTTIGSLPGARTLSRWHLEVEDWQPGATPTETIKPTRELELDGLAPWPEIPELRDVSGVGRYTAEVELGRKWAAQGQRGSRGGVKLELGPVFDSVRVRVNGKRAPVVDRYDAVLDITRYLRRGTNTIEVELATTLRNQLRTLDPLFAAVGRQPYGLTGPVRLVPYGEAPIRR